MNFKNSGLHIIVVILNDVLERQAKCSTHFLLSLILGQSTVDWVRIIHEVEGQSIKLQCITKQTQKNYLI